MILVYLRHAIAMERDEFARFCLKEGVDADDENRPLTVDGKKRMKNAAKGLAAAIETFGDHKTRPGIVTSPYLRATQTAEIVAEAIGQSASKPKKKSAKKSSKKTSSKSLVSQHSVSPKLVPGVSPKEFRDWLYDWLRSGAGHRLHRQEVLIVVGHEPDLSSHVGWWITGEPKKRFPFKKGGAICIEVGNALMPGEARLLWALPPWALREL